MLSSISNVTVNGESLQRHGWWDGEMFKTISIHNRNELMGDKIVRRTRVTECLKFQHDFITKNKIIFNQVTRSR